MSAARALPALLAGLLMACGSSGEPAQAAQADAAAQRPVPCAVQAHGMSGVVSQAGAACDDSLDPLTLPLDELIAAIPDQHPAFYYVLASRLFEAGRRDEAVFWFYAGQLRYRIRLACHPELAPDTEPALFGALQNDVGEVVNLHAGGDPQGWAAQMRRALDWDDRTRNGFEPKRPCARQIAEQREGLGQLIAYVDQNRSEIRRERAARGLPNR